ncbi:MAG: hypothetical protein QME57_04780 [Patescibacteria group bacterium]|nr:hypothetical protein [Patescibacteria group bacterium]
MPDYPPEQLWPLYEKLPEDLKETIFSEKTADTIYDVCTRNGLEEEKISEVAKYTGYVMLGLLPPDEFQKTLEEELKLENDLAKKVTLEITSFVFFPLKEELKALYKAEAGPFKAEVSSIKPEVAPASEIKPLVEEKPKEPRKDIYREPIE